MDQRSIPKNIPKRNGNKCPYKTLHTNVHSTIIHNRQKAETTPVSIYWWMDKWNVACPYNRMLFSNKKEQMVNVDESWKRAKWKKPVAEDHILQDCVYVNYPEGANL